ncbi:MAG: cyanophycin synthetase [Patescibacteria group bacterium]
MKIYCSGIGGIGLSAYASLQKAAGHDVYGSDRCGSPLTLDLKGQGIHVVTVQDGSGLPDDTDLLVYSEAIPEDAQERKKATALHIPQRSYPQALGDTLRGKKTIAVCGTHGKSSTTAMAARLLVETGMDPTVVVGTKMKELDGRNWRKGNGEYSIIEACEYRRSFLNYDPTIILLTNCDGDHFDYFKSKEDYAGAFVEFLRKLPEEGIVTTHMGDPECRDVVIQAGRAVKDADTCPLITLNTPGLHMRQNAQLVLALASVLNIPLEEATKSLSGFSGTWRRMEVKGEIGGVAVIDDYAHHPKEVAATVSAIRGAYPSRRIVAVFQPHTHDRTLKMYKDFTKAFTGTDILIIPDIYVARADIEHNHVDVGRFVKDIAKGSNVDARNGISLEETEHTLKAILRGGDVLLCMGAGTITSLASRMAER